jgi:SAM-dependent methyltransferase
MFTDIYTQGKYLDASPDWYSEDSPWKAQQILKIMRDNNLKPQTIGEIGCGAGEILNQLYDRLPDSTYFVGSEISPQAFDLCKTRQKDRLRFYLGDMIQDEKQLLDLILCIDVFEHVEDFYGFLKGLRNKSTYQIFHIPLDLYVANILRHTTLNNMRYSIGHIHYFTKETGLAALQDTGYEIIDCFYTNYAGELPAKSLLRKLAKVPRKILYSIDPDFAVRLMGGHELLVLTKTKKL